MDERLTSLRAWKLEIAAGVLARPGVGPDVDGSLIAGFRGVFACFPGVLSFFADCGISPTALLGATLQHPSTLFQQSKRSAVVSQSTLLTYIQAS